MNEIKRKIEKSGLFSISPMDIMWYETPGTQAAVNVLIYLKKLCERINNKNMDINIFIFR